MNPNDAKQIIAGLILLFTASVHATDIQVVSSGGFAEAYKELAPRFEKQTGNKLIAGWGPSMGTTKNAP